MVLVSDNSKIILSARDNFAIENQPERLDFKFIRSNGDLAPQKHILNEKQYYRNEDYYCFLTNPRDTDKKLRNNAMLDFTTALYSLAGLIGNNSYIVILHKESKRAVSFQSPLEGDLIDCSVSKDGMTLLMLSKSHACVIDNPLL